MKQAVREASQSSAQVMRAPSLQQVQTNQPSPAEYAKLEKEKQLLTNELEIEKRKSQDALSDSKFYQGQLTDSQQKVSTLLAEIQSIRMQLIEVKQAEFAS